MRVLERLARTRGLPVSIRCDNGPAFAGPLLAQWAHATGVFLDCIDPGTPTQHAFAERVNGRRRDACLNASWCVSLADAQAPIAAWRVDDMGARPPSGLAGRTRSALARERQVRAAGAIQPTGLPSFLDPIWGSRQSRQRQRTSSPREHHHGMRDSLHTIKPLLQSFRTNTRYSTSPAHHGDSRHLAPSAINCDATPGFMTPIPALDRWCSL